MIILIAGPSHTGKTVLAQKLLERYQFPYLSLDLLKMGLIRSGYTLLTPMDDERLTEYLWPIIREIIKTAIENRQNLIVEGCYIPFCWADDFDAEYQSEIRYRCLVMSEQYIRKHFENIIAYANIIENRLDDSGCTIESVLNDNRIALEMCQSRQLPYILIDDAYPTDIPL